MYKDEHECDIKAFEWQELKFADIVASGSGNVPSSFEANLALNCAEKPVSFAGDFEQSKVVH